jgi:hypothetical protein
MNLVKGNTFPHKVGMHGNQREVDQNVTNP